MTRVQTCALLAASFLLPAALSAQTPAPRATVAQPGGVAISPDGALVAWTLRQREGTTLHITAVADPDPAKERLVTPTSATSCSNTAPVWAPDSATLAYLSTCANPTDQPGQEQVFLYSRATGESRQLTHLKGNLQQLAWSPDGKSLAFLFVENATRSAGALDAMKPWNGVIGEDGVEIQGLYAVNAAKGDGQWIVDPKDKLHVYEFGWGPHGRQIAFIGAPAPGENNWWVAKLYSTPAPGNRSNESEAGGSFYTSSVVCADCAPDSKNCTGGCSARPAFHILFDPNTSKTAMHGLQLAVPRFSPDGTKIAFIGGLMSDQGSTGGDVWVLDLAAKNPEPTGTMARTEATPTDITASLDGTATYLAWTGNDSIGFVEDRRGHTLLTDYNTTTRTQDSTVDLGEVTLSGGSIKSAIGVSNRGLLAFVKSGFTAPPEVFVMNGSTNALTQLTHLNTGVTSTSHTESVEWTSLVSDAGGPAFHVQGWLTYPAQYDPAKKYPLIVTVHGGPSSSTGARFAGGDRGGVPWAALGYFEFQPNPRGSFGQGEAFTAANRKDFGYGDLRDILAGVDAVEKKVSIDDRRVGLTGWSYGGFMSMFAATQTHRFAAIVAGAGISDWQSYYGENSIDQWMVPFFGATVYDDPAVYAKSSAINFIKQARTPMLILVGDRDGECPAPQSFEMWHALKAQGVPTQLVIYPNEGHGFRDPAHIADRAKRSAAWFAKYMPEGQEAGDKE